MNNTVNVAYRFNDSDRQVNAKIYNSQILIAFITVGLVNVNPLVSSNISYYP